MNLNRLFARNLWWCLLLCAAVLRAEPLVMFAPGDPVFEDIRFLQAETGIPASSLTPPLSGDELETFLERLDPEALSPPAKNAYERVRERLNPAPLFSTGLFSMSVHASLNMETSVRTNKAVPWRESPRPRLIAAPFDFYFADMAQLHIEPEFRPFPHHRQENSYVNMNVPYKTNEFDSGEPFRAFIALGGAWWNFQLGRDRLSFGTAHTGNLLVSDTPDYYDFARVSVFSKNFKYSSMISQIPLVIDETMVDPAIVDLAANPSIQRESMERYLYLHRLDFKITRRLSIGAAEAMITGDSPIQLRYLNPLMIMHNFFSGYDSKSWGGIDLMDNMAFSLELNWSPFRSFRTYGQLMIDDVLTPFEKNDPNAAPNGMGYLAGIEVSHSFKKWALLGYGELVYTDPYVYVDNSPFAALIWWRRQVGTSGPGYRYRWLGHPQGRDMFQIAGGLRFSKDDTLALSADFSFTSQGEHSIVWDYANGRQYAEERTPTGTPENTLSLGFTASWKPAQPVMLLGGLTGIVLINSGHEAGKTAFGTEGNFGIRLAW
jgi:hypothetical protein